MAQEPDPTAQGPNPSVPTLLDTLEEWRNKCSSMTSQSNDALVPVFNKTLETIGTLVKPGGSRNEFVRSLSSMALERSNSRQFDARRDIGVRDLTYGMIECFHRAMLELDRNGWRPGWTQPIIRVKQEPREEESEEMPLFAPHVEVKTERAEAMDEGEEPTRRRQQSRPSLARSAFDLSDFGSGGEDGEEGSDYGFGSRMGGRSDFSRAASLPAADDGNGGGRAGGVTRKRRASVAKTGSLGCVKCAWHAGNSPGTVISHLRVKHGETTTSSGCYFRCQCGFESRSNNHAKKCADAQFTLVKDADKPFTPKRSYQKTPKKGNGNGSN